MTDVPVPYVTHIHILFAARPKGRFVYKERPLDLGLCCKVRHKKRNKQIKTRIIVTSPSFLCKPDRSKPTLAPDRFQK